MRTSLRRRTGLSHGRSKKPGNLAGASPNRFAQYDSCRRHRNGSGRTNRATTEHTINDALAAALRKTRHLWRGAEIVKSENTSLLRGSTARPDILVLEANVSPVVIETEVIPAATVEAEAKARLGQRIRTTGRTILSSIAVRLPARLREMQGDLLTGELNAAADFEMALFTGESPTNSVRWPHSGWIAGTVADLSVLAQSASVPPAVIEAAADQLVNGVREAAGLIGEMAATHPAAIRQIAEHLRQEDGEQTRRMATTILANAFIFHDTLAGGPGELADVKSLEQLAGANTLKKSHVLAEWRKILTVNYWPIFDVARRILEDIPVGESKALIEGLRNTAETLLENRLMRSHDLTGAIFQKLIADRKFLAAYYTTPASAALLAGLAIGPTATPKGESWSKPDHVKSLRVGDFACGTGTLLSTAYQRIGQLHELAGGNSAATHPKMMATGIVGCDVFPAAAHLTASMLSGAHPAVKYGQSSIMTVAYGKRSDGAIALGSLDSLDPQRKMEVLDITATALEGMGKKERETWSSLPHASFDLVIMNPPFTRATGHEGKKIGVPVPMFAAFGIGKDEQREMSKAALQLTKNTSAHGNAGEASMFLVLANRKLRTGGTLALVLPLSLMAGDAWEKSRELLASSYSDLLMISIAGASDSDLSFSADTGMGECLVICRKERPTSRDATFVVLKERPGSTLLGASIAGQIRTLMETGEIRGIEDGPVGGTPLSFGSDIVGQVIRAPLPKSGPWNISRIADLALAQTAFQITAKNRLWLPATREDKAVSVPITTVSTIGKIGPYHMDIVGETPGGGIRGPFSLSPIQPNAAPTYPVLWSHDTESQRTMAFGADNDAQPLCGANKKDRRMIEERVDSVWSSASHCHFNRDFRFNSQSVGMQFTPKKTIGGHAWPSIKLPKVDQEKALVAWANTTFGLLLHWWHVNKQQSGRGRSGVESLASLPVLDVTNLAPNRLSSASQIFDELGKNSLLSMNEMGIDPVRKELDRRFGVDVLGLDANIVADGGPLDLLRDKLGAEPSVRGGK